MKRLFLFVLSFLILSTSTSFGGSFYNPDPKELREKGQEAAEKLNESFVHFYQMLTNIEGNKIDDAKGDKERFDTKLEKEALPIFVEIRNKATETQLQFEFTPPTPQLKQLEQDLDYFQKRYYENQKIDTQKKLTELPVTLIGLLVKKSGEFQIKPKETDFFPKLRSLIMTTIDVQWVGVQVSELWAISEPQTKNAP